MESEVYLRTDSAKEKALAEVRAEVAMGATYEDAVREAYGRAIESERLLRLRGELE